MDDHPVALYFTGWQHAGENLAAVLRQRRPGPEPPIQMCNALSRNLSVEFQSILAHCLSHGRRGFVSLAENFPTACRYVLEALGEVDGADAQAKEQRLTPDQRLARHQTDSQPVMERLHTGRLNGVNPFDYLLAIATHAEAVKLIPKAWLHWNYPKSPARLDTS